jgi:hypothetical protein
LRIFLREILLSICFDFLGDPLLVLPELLNILYEQFGGHKNGKGFKVLDKHVRIIQGDGVNINSIKDILNVVEKNGFSADNLVFGSGGKRFLFIYLIKIGDFY